MKERPILFSGPMVRAILDGRKTQTRRVVKSADSGRVLEIGSNRNWHLDDQNATKACPYQPGMKLWVRETWAAMPGGPETKQNGVIYRSTDGGNWTWKPSIHMPRWACRIVLEITEVRVQRLNEIIEEDAMAEGVREGVNGEYWIDGLHWQRPTGAFRELWESINGAGSWDANPFVRAITFMRIQ